MSQNFINPQFDDDSPEATTKISWRASMAQDMHRTMDRSNLIREDVHNRLYVKARNKIDEILSLPITDKNVATIAATATKLLEYNKVAAPSMNFQAVAKITHLDQDSPQEREVIETIELTQEQVQQATQNAIRAQLQIAQWRKDKEDARAIAAPQADTDPSRTVVVIKQHDVS